MDDLSCINETILAGSFTCSCCEGYREVLVEYFIAYELYFFRAATWLENPLETCSLSHYDVEGETMLLSHLTTCRKLAIVVYYFLYRTCNVLTENIAQITKIHDVLYRT